MAQASNPARFLNPWVLHHQKLGLELKCPICLNLLNRPKLLPCNHIFCDFCVPRSSQFGSECPVCKQQYADRDVRTAPYMENLVTIYRNLDATFSTGLFQPISSDARRVIQSPLLLNTNADNALKESAEMPLERNSSNGQCIFSSATNRRVQASVIHSVIEGNKLAGISDNPSPLMLCEVQDLNNGGERGKRHDELCRGEIDITHVLQSSPITPPSLDTKGTEDDCSDPGSSNGSTEIRPAKRLFENSKEKAVGEMQDRTLPGAGEDQTGDVKRQKKLNHGVVFDTGLASNDCTVSNIFYCDKVATSKLETNTGVLSGGKTCTTVSQLFDANGSSCAFCQSSKITDQTGSMLHYLNGKEVAGEAALKSNVIDVHKICIEWTPQAYFVGETVKNLKAEVARAAKLKCGSCGLKGAALGCFVKSCRKSYHVPCAAEKPGCRWDFVGGLSYAVP